MSCRAAGTISQPMLAPTDGPIRVSFEKIDRTLPTFKSKCDARMGAEKLYAACRKSSLTHEEFEGPRYQRIGHIEKLMADGVIDGNSRHTSRAIPSRAPAAAE
jgi:hypothetical protein